MNKRIEWVDLFRGIMIICIVFGHAIAGGILNRYVFFHVAAFFFISGYLFECKKADSFSHFVRNKFRSLMIPFYCFSLLSILIFILLGQIASDRIDVAISSTDILPNLLGMIYANGATGYMKWNLPLWFLPCLFVSLLVMYGICRAISASRANNHCTPVPVGVILALLIAFNFVNYHLLDIRSLPFGLENTAYLLPFTLAGYGWKQAETRFKNIGNPGRFGLGVLLILAGCALGWMKNSRIDYVTIDYGHLFTFYVSAFLCIFGFVSLCGAIGTCKPLQYVGRNTLPILLMHKFPLVLLQMILKDRLSLSPTGICFAVAITAFACGASLLAGEVIGRILPVAVGKRKGDLPCNLKQSA